MRKATVGKTAKNYLYNLGYQLLVLLVPLVTAPYLVRTLGAQQTGVFGYVHSTTALICTMVMLGIFNYGSRQVAYVRDVQRMLNDTFWRLMTVRLVLACLGTVIYLTVVAVVGRYQSLFLLYYTYLAGYFVDCTWLYVGVEDMKWAALKNVFLKLVTVAGIFLFIHDPGDIRKYVLIQGGSILLANLLAYTQLHQYIGRPKLVFKGIKNDIWQSAMLFLPSMASTLYLECDKIMLELMTNDSRQVSFYSYSEKIVMIPLSFITVMNVVMMPRIANEFANGNRTKIASILDRVAEFSVFLAFPMFVGIISIAGKLIPWYLGGEFLPAVSVIWVIAPIILTNTLSGISGSQYFTATNQPQILLKAQLSAAVGNVLINALLIPKLGFVGAAIATVISSSICAIVQYCYLLKQVKLPGLLPAVVRYGALSLAMAAVIWLVTRHMAATALTTVIQITVGVVFYLLACLLAKDRQLTMLLSQLKQILHGEEEPNGN